jgi:dephospho-CoA kinase
MTAADRPTGPGFRIGLTGPIGCGKSTIAGWLGELGATVIDADRLVRAVTGPGEPTLGPIRARFGEAVVAADGTLARAALAALVFSDDAALRDLEAILHPAVRLRIRTALEEARAADAPIVVIEAIKLIEAGHAATCDEVWLVGCGPATQRQRLVARGMPADDAERRLATQGTDLLERLAADLEALPGWSGDAGRRDGRPQMRRISTDGSLADVRERVEEALADALEPLFFPPPGSTP